MSRRMIAVLAALTIVAAALASTVALGSSASHKAPQAQHKTYTFYLVAGIASDAFYLTMKKGAEAEAKKLGNVKVIFTGSPAAFSPNTQIPFLNGAIARKPDAILIAPTDKTALIAPIQRAIKAGIPVATVDTYNTNPIAFTNITTDNLAGGRAAADALVKAIGGSGDVAAISAVLSVGAMRIASGLRAIAPFRKGICVFGEKAAGEPVKMTFTLPSVFASACAPFFIVR
jgi:ribose transport system substrate-binding protein